MSRKRENVFIGRVHKHLPRHVHAEKTNNPYRRGTPDCYYEAPGNKMLWIEYKWIDKFPEVLTPTELSGFTKLQQRWLQRAHANGIPVALVIGSPEGVVICNGLDWQESFEPRPMTPQEAIRWISEKLS